MEDKETKSQEDMVKEAVEDGKISRERYESYISFFRELKERERRRYS